MEEDLKQLIGANEKILYEGRPNRRCFIYESIFNPLMPFALLWGILDIGIIGGVSSTFGSEEKGMVLFMIIFFMFHLMPVWIYLAGVIFSIKKYKNTYYIVTDGAVYISSGLFTKTFNIKPFQEMSRVDLHRGIFDQKFGVGDIIISSNQYSSDGRPAVMKISSISEYTEVFSLVKKLQKDIYTDSMYPNDLRPKENHGYQTEYKG